TYPQRPSADEEREHAVALGELVAPAQFKTAQRHAEYVIHRCLEVHSRAQSVNQTLEASRISVAAPQVPHKVGALGVGNVHLVWSRRKRPGQLAQWTELLAKRPLPQGPHALDAVLLGVVDRQALAKPTRHRLPADRTVQRHV